MLSQYLALTKDGGEEIQQEQSFFYFQKNQGPSFFLPIYQAIKMSPCDDLERGIPPCCYTESNVC